MLLRFLFLVGLFVIGFGVNAQYNLVPNWSFEDSVVCPNSLVLDPIPSPWYSPTKFECRKAIGYYSNRCSNVPWASVPYNYDTSTSLYSSYQETKTGDGYVMLPTYNGWLYLQTPLKQPLQVGKKYWCNYWVSTVNISKYACNNLGMLFTNTPIYADTLGLSYCNGLLAANPQVLNFNNPIINDTLNWVSVSGIYTAIGGEQYITLGNFKPDSLTDATLINNTIYTFDAAGYYVDDVSVIPLDSFNLKADAGKDTTIHIGDSVFIGTYTNGIDTIKWQILNTNTIIDSLRPGFWVKPTTDICYTLTQTVNGFTSSDTVCVYVLPLPLTFLKFEVRSTSENGGSIPLLGGVRGGFIQNLWTTASEINVSHFNIQRSINGKDFTTIGKVAAQNKITNEYNFTDELIPKDQNQKTIYYRIQSVDKDGRKQYSEIKSVDRRPLTVNSIAVYPNPAKDNVTIECKGAKELMIIDYLGRTVYRSTVDSRPLTVNTKEFSKGVYVVKAIMNNGEIKTEKLIVE